MRKNIFSDNLRIHFSNAIGKSINRKIVVLESDDWGSIRTYGSEAYNFMKQHELAVDNNHYGYDALESNQDFEMLFNVLYEYKDSTGRHPVITPLCNMGNPDINKIIESGYSQYFFQPLHETIKEYPQHDKLLEYWKYGSEHRLFVPALHGREHININRFMDILRTGDVGFRLMLNQKSVGVSGYKGMIYPNYLGALHPQYKSEIPALHHVLREGGKLFKKYTGFDPEFFVAPNAEEPKELEATLHEIGVKYIGRAKRRIYPLGDGAFKSEWNWFGKQNEYRQTILVRNAFFEPVCFGEKDKEHITDWVDHCLHHVEIAFKWKKPAVISTHRVNYIGYISTSNREKGIKALRRLLKSIITKWPDVEFMTSMELGALLKNK
jgi:hypothetical protein